MDREIYFDNAATTRPYDSVIDIVNKTMSDDYGNPSSLHTKGVQAEKYIRKATEIIADTLKADKSEIIYTSGGTESDNQAIIGTALARQRDGKHIITSAIEHPAVYETYFFLKNIGYDITIIPVDDKGLVSPKAVSDAMRDDTILVSIMHVNNEIGAIEPIEEIAKEVKKKNKKTYMHVDAIQSYGKIRIRPSRIGIDMMSVSGHKIHGPKGIGFLYAAKGIKLKPIIYGGGQQSGRRSGTLNVSGIAGIGEAARVTFDDFENKISYIISLKDRLIDGISDIDDIHINSYKGYDSAPHIISISVEGVRAEVLLHALEEKGIYVSSGSACSSNHPGISGTLSSIGLDKKYLESTIRVSLSDMNKEDEVDIFIDNMKKIIMELRKYR